MTSPDPLPADPLPADPLPADPLPAAPLPADPLPADPAPDATPTVALRRKTPFKTISEKKVGEITEKMIEEAVEPLRFSLRDGLVLFVRDGGHRKTFHMRIRSANGKGSSTKIGEYGQLSLQQAREKARLVNSKITAVRSEKILKAMVKEVRSEKVKPRIKSQSYFTNFDKFRNQIYQLKPGLRNDDLLNWTWLIALAPTINPNAIAAAKWSDISPTITSDLKQPIAHWPPVGGMHDWGDKEGLSTLSIEKPAIKTVKDLSNIKIQILSNYAIFYIINIMHYNRPGDFLFPSLAEIDIAELKEITSAWLHKVFENDKIDPTDFGLLFRDYSIKKSCFHPKFIESVLNGTRFRGESISTMTRESKALLDWWAKELVTNRVNF